MISIFSSIYRLIIKDYFFLVLIFILGCNQYPKNYKTERMIRLDKLEHINDFKWYNRVLIINNKNQKNLLKQVKNSKKKLYNRDIIIIILKEKNAYINDKVLSEKFYKTLKKKIRHLDNSYKTILIGRDGKIKKIYKKNIDLNRVFLDIDKMPMRINEMKNDIY